MILLVFKIALIAVLILVKSIFRVYMFILVLQNTSHSTLIEYNVKNKFCPRWDSNPRPLAFAASVLPLDHESLTVEKEQYRG